MTLHLPISAVRTLHLAAQGLLKHQRKHATKQDVLQAIRRMSALQIDTISVVARSPWLVLFSRIGAFEHTWLEELLAEGKLFEYWSHEACFLPIEDYALYRHRMIDPGSMGWKYSHAWHDKHPELIASLIDRIRTQGPVRSADFERTGGKSNGWWDWKPEKRTLEILYTAGELMVCRRERFQRVYDLRSQVLPDWNDSRDLPSNTEVDRKLVHQSVQALGITRSSWVADYFRMKKLDVMPVLHRLVEEGAVQIVHCKDLRGDLFLDSGLFPLLDDARTGKLQSTVTRLLSPFDPIVWDRKRALELFDFDYRIECYTPAPKRKYGYFVLPVLHRGKLVGRLDAKAHRQLGIFEIKSLYLEPNTRISKQLATDLAQAIQKLANWHGTSKVEFVHGPIELIQLLRETLANH